jgi:hypothetical protein
MKKIYTLHILGASSGVYNYTVEATHFQYDIQHSSSSGFYSFYDGDNLVGCYPIDRTLIVRIDEDAEV